MLTFLIRYNADGKLTLNESVKGTRNGFFKDVNQNMPRKKIEKVFNLYDRNNDTVIKFDEFLQWYIENDIKKEFDKIDVDEKGTLAYITLPII